MAHSVAQCEAAWELGGEIPGHDPAEWRADHFGRLMRRTDFRNRGSPFGWTVRTVRGALLEEKSEASGVLAPVHFETIRGARRDR